MHKVLITLLLALGLSLSGFNLSAQVIFVDHNAAGMNNGSNWTDAFQDLQQALSIAQYGDQIWLAEGHYYPTDCDNCSEADRLIAFVIPDGVALYGGFTGTETSLDQRDWIANATYLDGDLKEDYASFNNSYTIVYTEEVSAATIVDGLHIVNGNANYANSLGNIKASGAAWFNESNSMDHPSNPTIRNCIFEDNKASGYGGALCNIADFSAKCEPLIENVQFINNQAKGGGAIFNDGSHQGICKPIIRNCTFEGNNVDQFGGAINNDGGYNGECSPIIENCSFINNSCDSGGGAIANRGHENGNSHPTIIASHFIDNHSGAIGGAVLNFGINGSASPSFYRCQFELNFASTYGGAIYNHGKEGASSPKVVNCLFYKNEAYSCAGMYNLGSTGGNASPIVTSCTFYANIAKYGTCIYNNAGSSGTGTSSPVITNSIFWDNIATQIPEAHIFRNVSGTPTISHSLVDANTCESLNSGTGTNTVDCSGGMIYNQFPKFVDTLNGDFHLSANSPALDIGDNSLMADYFDLDNNLRLFNSTIDLGVFEFGSMPYAAPAIESNPLDENACEASNVEFEVEASGSGPLQYQWFKNDDVLAGENQSTLSLTNVTSINEAAYSCRVISILNDTVYSSAANLEVAQSLVVGLTINADQTEICEGTSINFSATPVNGGSNPVYTWEVNGVDQGVNDINFSSTNLSDGDEVVCRLVSSKTCVQNAEAVSESIAIAVHPELPVSVSISSSAVEVCGNDSINLLASGVNSGTSPTYEWSLNGNVVGTNNPNLSIDNLSDGDELSCKLISSETCVQNAEAISESIAITVHPELPVSVSISSSAVEICGNDSINLLASGVNGGTSPTYEWSLNGSAIGANSPSLSIDDLSDGDELSCKLISSETCVQNMEAVSESIAITVHPELPVSVSISSSAVEICGNESINLLASGVNGGTSPTYEWSLNGSAIGTNSPSLSIDNLSDGDELSCKLISSETCVQNVEAISESIAIIVHPELPVSVSISSSAVEVCSGESIDLVASSINGGTSPTYEWSLNGSAIGTNSPSLSIDNLSDGDELSCKLISSETCVQNAEALSNAINIVVNDLLEASLNIATSSTNICAGESLSIIADPFNQGINPVYEWRLNGELLDEDSTVLNLQNLSDGDEIQCKLISSKACVLNQEVLSNSISITVTPLANAEIELSANQLNICETEQVNLTTNVVNAGASPSYTWYLNGTEVLDTSSNLTLDNLANGDEIYCILSSSENCIINPIVSSNTLQITVNPLSILELSIAASAIEVCAGEAVDFTATITNDTIDYALNWYLNGAVLGITTSDFTTAELEDGDLISCIIQSDAACLVNEVDTSNLINLTVHPNLTPSITIESSQSEFCKGDTIVIESMVTNQGANPSFLWYLNDEELVGENAASWFSDNLNDEDEIRAVLISSENCLTENEVPSNTLNLDIKDCTVGLSILANNEAIKLYPNPSDGIVTLELANLKNPTNLYIVDSKGLIVYEDFNIVLDQSKKLQIDLSKLSSGLYFVKLVTAKSIFSETLFLLD